MITWVNFLHIYQPPGWDPTVIQRVVNESYRPVLAILKRHPQVRLTINMNAALTEQLVRQGYKDIIDDLADLVGRKQVVLTGSALYHTILPLLPESEMERQIRLNTERNAELVGAKYHPMGFFPPEMCYSRPVAEVAQRLGFQWLMADEISCLGTIGDVRFDRKYHIRDLGLPIVFRHRGLSDLFFSDHLKRAEDFFTIVEHDPQINNVLVTAFDGENLGHHRPGLERIWEQIVTDPRVETITVPEFLKRTTTIEEIVPRPASWSSNVRELDAGIPYVLWQHPENPIHQRQWELTHLAIETVETIMPSRLEYGPIRSALDESLASDQYWWASAQPWWGPEFVLRGVDRFVTLIDSVPGVNQKTIGRAFELRKEIADIVRDWQESGKAQKIKAAYLSGDSRPRYLGGEKVS